MHAQRRRFSASSSQAVALLKSTKCGCFDCAPGGAGQSGCPSFVSGDLIRALRDNRTAVEAVSLFAQTSSASLAGSIFLAPLAVPLAALAVVLTSLLNNCDVGEALQGEARQAALGAKIGANVCAIATMFVLPAPVTIPIGAIFGGLIPILDALGSGKAPKLGDVSGFVGSAAKIADANGTHVDTSAITSAANIDPGVLNAVAGNKDVQALVGQAASVAGAAAPASTTAQVHDGFLASVRAAIADAFARSHMPDLEAVLQTYMQPQPGVAGNVRMHVLRFVAKWKQAGRPELVGSVQIWNSEVPSAPFTAKEVAVSSARAKASDLTAQNAAKARARELTEQQRRSGADAGDKPDNVVNLPVKVPKKLSKGQKVAIGVGAAGAGGLLLKLVIGALA